MASSVACTLGMTLMAFGSLGLYSIETAKPRIVLGDRADALDLPLPESSVVRLEWMIDPVLAQPKREHRRARLARLVEAAPGEVDGLAPDRGLGIGERTRKEVGVTVVAHGVAVECHAQGVESLAHLRRADATGLLGVVDVDGGQPARGRGTLDEIEGVRTTGAPGPEELRPRLEGVEPGGIAIAVHRGSPPSTAVTNLPASAVGRGSVGACGQEPSAAPVTRATSSRPVVSEARRDVTALP